MRVVAIIQARMNSSRLPGKVLEVVEGKPIIEWQFERLSLSRLVDEVVVATSDKKNDDPIVKWCKKNKIKFYRGSESDVLKRVNEAIKKFNAYIHVECFGDSPLVDPKIIDEYIGFFIKNIKVYDFVSNTIHHTYPGGLECSIYKGSTLAKVNKMVKSNDKHREHVGYNIRRFPKIFKLCSLKAPKHLNRKNISLELDEKKDLILLKKIFKHFNKNKKLYFSSEEILNYLDKNKKLIKINSQVKRRWKKFL